MRDIYMVEGQILKFRKKIRFFGAITIKTVSFSIQTVKFVFK
jgi:hypothetical protein